MQQTGEALRMVDERAIAGRPLGTQGVGPRARALRRPAGTGELAEQAAGGGSMQRSVTKSVSSRVSRKRAVSRKRPSGSGTPDAQRRPAASSPVDSSK